MSTKPELNYSAPVETERHLVPEDLVRLRQYLQRLNRRRAGLYGALLLTMLVLAVPFCAILIADQVSPIGGHVRVVFVLISCVLAICAAGVLDVTWQDHPYCQAIKGLSDDVLERAWAYILDDFFCELLHSVIIDGETASQAILSWSQIPLSLRSVRDYELSQLKLAEQHASELPDARSRIQFYVSQTAPIIQQTKQLCTDLSPADYRRVQHLASALMNYASGDCATQP